MDKQPLTKEEIERLLVDEVQTYPDCAEILEILVVPVEDHASIATWTVSCFRFGGIDGDAYDLALQKIVPRFQRIYDMVRRH